MQTITQLRAFTFAQISDESPAKLFPIDLLPTLRNYMYENELALYCDIEEIVKDDNINLLKYADNNQHKIINRYFSKEQLMAIAAGNNHLEMVKFLHYELGIRGDEFAITHAAEFNHLDMVKLLHYKLGIRGDTSAITYAAENNHLDMVKFLHHELNIRGDSRAIAYAAKNNHLDMVKFLYYELGIPGDNYAISWAAENNHLEMVKFLREELNL